MHISNKNSNLAHNYKTVYTTMVKDYKYKVTIGMPVYGVEKYIRKSLFSALSQTYKEEYEVLVVDDLGPDNSMSIVKELQASHPRGKNIRILTQPQNMGCWAARNRILDEAQGEYLLLLDSDDYLSEDALEKMIDVAEKYKTDVVYGSVEPIPEAGKPTNLTEKDIKLPFKLLLGKDELASYANQDLHATLYNFIWNVLFRMEFLKKHQIRFQETRFSDDILFATDMQPLVERAVLLSDVTYNYVLRPGSLSNFQIRKEIKLSEIEQLIKIYTYIKNQARTLKGKPYYETRCAKAMIYMFYVICGALKNREKITPALTDEAIRDAMKHPLGIWEILSFKKYRVANLIFWLIGTLAPRLSVMAQILLGKKKHLL